MSASDPLANPDAPARPSGWGTRIPSREEMEPPPEPDHADSGGARSDPRSGAIAGRISYVGAQQFQQSERGWSTLLAVVLAIGVAASATRLLLTTFLPYLALAVLLFLVLQWATRGYFGRAIGSMGRLFMVSRAFAPRPDPRMSPVLPFRVDAADGQEVQCTIRGDLDGGSFQLGDRVELAGRMGRRSGVYEASEVRNTDTGAITAAHVPVRDRMNRAALWVLPLAVIWAAIAVLQAYRTVH